MNKLVAGSMEMDVIGVYGFSDTHNGAAVDALKVSLPADITEEQITALLENPWNIYSEDGALQGVHAGCNHVKEYTITFLKVTVEALLLAQLQTAADEIAAARQEAQEALAALAEIQGAVEAAGLSMAALQTQARALHAD